MKYIMATLLVALTIAIGVNVAQATTPRPATQQTTVRYVTGKFNVPAFEQHCEDILNRAVNQGDVNMYDYNRQSCQSVAATLPNYWSK